MEGISDGERSHHKQSNDDGITRYIFTFVDYGSKLAKLAFLSNKRAETIVNALTDFFKDLRERPKLVQFDNGKEFNNKAVHSYLELNNIDCKHGRPYSPEDQGSCEAFNKTVNNALKSILN